MRRTLLIFLVVLIAMANLSFATVTRTKTMGRVGHWVEDDSNIFPWPSTVARFSDRFILEMGEGTFGGGYNPILIGPRFPNGFGGGALFGLDDTHHLGFYASANDRSNGGGVADTFFPQGLSIDDFLTLFYGYAGTGNLDFGLNLNMGSSRNEQTAPEAAVSKQSVGRMGVQGGATYRLEDGKFYEVALGFQKTSITDEAVDGTGATVTNLESDGYNTLSARARMFWDYTAEIQFVPFIEYRKENKGVKQDVDADGENDEVKEKISTYNIAMGASYSPHERIQMVLVGGILLMRSTTTILGDETVGSELNHLPYIKSGIETKIRDWLDFRAGVEKQLVKEEIVPFTTADKMVSSQYQGYVGAGLHVAGWTIDMQVNPNLFYNGPNFISGASDVMNHRVSLVRPW